TSSGDLGLMLVVDAGVLFQLVTRAPAAAAIATRLLIDELAAPHIVDVEVLGIIRRWFLSGELDGTAASLAVENLRNLNGQRFGHQLLLRRAWELRANVRGWDAMYVALAE